MKLWEKKKSQPQTCRKAHLAVYYLGAQSLKILHANVNWCTWI